MSGEGHTGEMQCGYHGTGVRAMGFGVTGVGQGERTSAEGSAGSCRTATLEHS